MDPRISGPRTRTKNSVQYKKSLCSELPQASLPQCPKYLDALQLPPATSQSRLPASREMRSVCVGLVLLESTPF